MKVYIKDRIIQGVHEFSERLSGVDILPVKSEGYNEYDCLFIDNSLNSVLLILTFIIKNKSILSFCKNNY